MSGEGDRKITLVAVRVDALSPGTGEGDVWLASGESMCTELGDEMTELCNECSFAAPCCRPSDDGGDPETVPIIRCAAICAVGDVCMRLRLRLRLCCRGELDSGGVRVASEGGIRVLDCDMFESLCSVGDGVDLCFSDAGPFMRVCVLVCDMVLTLLSF